MTNRDILGTFLLSVLLWLTVSVTDNMAIRILLSVPLVLFLTGHVVLRVLAPIRGQLVEHAVYAVGISIAISVLGGFILNGFSLLTPIGWTLWLMGVTGVVLVISLIRRTEPLVLPTMTWPRLARWQIVMLLLSLCIVSSAYALAVKDESSQREFKYTEFWLVPSTAYGILHIGIRSYEDNPKRFDIEVTSADAMIARWNNVEMTPGETWTKQISVGDNDRRVEARLYDAADHSLYRRVSALPRELKR
jgi:uncharacterized membrane protein